MSIASRLALALLLPVTAWAQPAAAPPAESVQEQLQSWLDDLLGPTLAADVPRLHVATEDDHYRITLPFNDSAGPAEATASIHPLDGGRWSIDSLRLPETTHFHVHLPEAETGSDAVPTDLMFRIGAQDSHGLVDPGLASPSRLDLELNNIDLTSNSAERHQQQHIDRYALSTTLAPQGDRLALDGQATITGWRIASRVGDAPAVAFGADRIATSGGIGGIDRAHGAALLAAISGFMATLPAANTAAPHDAMLPQASRAALRRMIETMRGVIETMHGEETIEGLHIAVAGQGEAVIGKLRLGMDGAAPGGLLHTGFDIMLDGMTLRDAPPTVEALMPHHLTLRPSLDGVSLAGLTALMLQATETGVDDPKLQSDAEAVLQKGPVTLGLDALELDIGPAELQGHGRMVLSGADDYRAELHFSATGLDALIKQARGNPELQQALPILALLRGFARPDGERLAWDVSADNAGLMVNGVPMGGPPAEKAQPNGKPHPNGKPQPSKR